MRYDLDRFSTQSFERFVQALAADLFGAKVQIFGAGRDGAREATHRGTCTVNGTTWTGYTVVQAKYHASPGKPADNAKWLIQQIAGELAKFADTKRALETPEFYIIASNVQLSAAAGNKSGKGQGGIDTVEKYLREEGKKL